jgi:heat shock protein HspQ
MHLVLEGVIAQFAAELNGLNAETTQLHPRGLAHKWTAQQVVEHLVLDYRKTAQDLEIRLSKGHRPRNRNVTRLQWLLQLMMLSFGVYPRGVPASEEATPVPGSFAAMSGRQLSDLLREEMESMDAALDKCRQKFGMEKVARHTLLGPMRVDQWRRFHVIHGEHHLVQLRDVIAQVSPEFAPARSGNDNLVKELQVPVQGTLA